jgi:VIT1/CCC1 family predicted Fe2+/Mn2+ transporter
VSANPNLDQQTIARYRRMWQEEVDSAATYRALANLESRPDVASVYALLAESEERHAALWRQKLESAGLADGTIRPSWRARLNIWIARRFGIDSVLPMLVRDEVSGARAYAATDDSSTAHLPAEERSHARVFRELGRRPGGLAGEAVARIEGRHRAAGGNALRAAVLGANDGLVSNFSLVMGVAGAELASSTILLTGIAGLLAGAISMALGEWLSVQSSRELYTRQLEIERTELETNPEEEEHELALIYQAKGVAPGQARDLARGLLADRGTALDTLAREELGIDPEGLGGSAWIAALTSFLLFAVGAVIPVLPYFMLGGMPAVLWSAAISALGLFAIGASITLFTGRGMAFSGFRQVAFGLAAAGVTYGLGRLVGVGLAG